VRNTLKLKKNLCIAKKFNILKKEELLKGRTFYIDVWPVRISNHTKFRYNTKIIFPIFKINFLVPELCTQFDSTCLFMLQLACILNMVSVWRRGILRVFLCTDSVDPIENARRKSRLDDLLNQLRIHALTCLVQLDNVKSLLNRPAIPEADLIRLTQNATSPDLLTVSDTYLKSVNQLVRQHSDQSPLCFLYLPAPPVYNASFNENAINDTGEPNEVNQRYMKACEIISDSLQSCLFVNGISCVTSTNL
jgi:potassium/chloride transporter 9